MHPARRVVHLTAMCATDGDGVDRLILAYYPSPAPSPRRSPGLGNPFFAMTPLSGSGSGTPNNYGQPSTKSRRGSSVSITSQEARSEIIARVRRESAGAGNISARLNMSALNRRMSEGHGTNGDHPQILRRKSSRIRTPAEQSEELKKLRALLEGRRKAELKQGQNDEPTPSVKLLDPNFGGGNFGGSRVLRGTYLRCKMCRRDLAAREHIVEHEPGQGQKAFAPRRRDMTQHRLDMEKKRLAKAEEADAKGMERQRLAKEAAEDLLDEVEEAVTSNPDTSAEVAEEAQTDVDAIPMDEDAKKPDITVSVPQPLPAQGGTPLDDTVTSRSLSARLPPHLAALRVSMPSAHDYTIGRNGSAIADEDATPLSEGPPSPPLLPSVICTSYFTEPLSWMQSQLENGELNGKIL